MAKKIMPTEKETANVAKAARVPAASENSGKNAPPRTSAAAVP